MCGKGRWANLAFFHCDKYSFRRAAQKAASSRLLFKRSPCMNAYDVSPKSYIHGAANSPATVLWERTSGVGKASGSLFPVLWFTMSSMPIARRHIGLSLSIAAVWFLLSAALWLLLRSPHEVAATQFTRWLAVLL